jgi:hypothetical protein
MFARSGWAQSRTDEAQANPGRPTVSTPATLTPVGYLQLENRLPWGTALAGILIQAFGE